MAACDACGATIIFGGAREGELRFCNARCHSKGFLVRVARQISPDVIASQTSAVYHGSCPKCKGPGPVDVRMSYRVWSAVVLTSWKNTPQISCRGCGIKSQIGDGLISAIAGWWGIPWGIVMTPVQIGRNIAAAFSTRADHGPTKELEKAVSLMLAAEGVRRAQEKRIVNVGGKA